MTNPPHPAGHEPHRVGQRAFQVDLWNARGEFPRDLNEAAVRQKEIQFSSRTRAATDQFRTKQRLRRAVAHLIEQLPDGLRQQEEVRALEQEADRKVYNIIHLIYRSRNYEGTSKDYDFSRRAMEEHWQSGYDDAIGTLRHPEVLQRPDNPEACAPSTWSRTGGSRTGGMIDVDRPTMRTGDPR
ncbi:MAG: DUF3734 domain-containing protein [Chromatiales bacterium]